ncbi:alginate lyase family protein [Myceligenerans pegani]|uniref:Alginate lyase family protein n=1 Tax=Myceligenerans pegani TaxID=2776917 RepID=A0ABR9N0W4_9MICO|nr:alginate lyase family protein [Myceligenerans sp. TRM 65318]MBE1877264.1 alginate lyase family protein [Myceligenerans sp. TRM 65318]MBE3019535.1 alginate lyase family protein [Myceligenerans sp. TRM 65318]
MRLSVALVLTVLIAVSGCAQSPVGVKRALAEPTVTPSAASETAVSAESAESGRTRAPDVPDAVSEVRPAPRSGKGESGQAGSGEPAGEGFVHPGVFVDEVLLDAMRRRVEAGEDPAAQVFTEMMRSKWGSLDHRAEPRAVVECGGHQNPDHGCTEERRDAHAAYAQALAWVVTGDEAHARKSIEIMNAWSSTIRGHTNTNARLQAAWAGAIWARAAEIIRHTGGGWPETDAERFERMLRDVYLPQVTERSYANGNWELAMTEAAVGIAVFLDDREVYDRAVSVFRNRARAYVYLESDGDLPREASGSPYDTEHEIIAFWQGQRDFRNGVAQETCRDLSHTTLGLTAMSHVLMTTSIQGDDLYPRVGPRLAAAFELHAEIELTDAVPSWLCGGSVDGRLEYLPSSALSVLAGRFGCPMTWSRRHDDAWRTFGTNELLTAWEPLTHGAPAGPRGSSDPELCP